MLISDRLADREQQLLAVLREEGESSPKLRDEIHNFLSFCVDTTHQICTVEDYGAIFKYYNQWKVFLRINFNESPKSRIPFVNIAGV